MRLPFLGLLGIVAALLLAGCGATAPPAVTPDVDVDTPALRTLKKQAGIADCPASGESKAPKGGLPDVTLPCLGGGREVDLGGLRGPLVVNLWAQWCGPCRAELPIYQRFHRTYADRVGVLGVDWNDTRPESALRLAREAGVTYPLVADLEPAVRARALPTVLLIDADGRVAHQEAVEITSLAQLEALVREHLGVV